MRNLPELNNTYIAMRHGRSKPNEDGIVAAHSENDGGLVSKGFEQAEASSRASGLGSNIYIVSSDLPRARQTAETLQVVTGAEDLVIDPRLRERGFGDMELQSADLYHEVWARDANSATHTYRGVESLCHLAERQLDLVSELEGILAARVIVLVGHADPLNVLKAALWGESLRGHRKTFSIGNAEMQTLATMRKS